jgi:riboflavin kinase/FMN adenylyltransferase
MIVCRSLKEIPADLPFPVVTIGNFDGVHLGHKAIFRRIKEAAAANKGVSVVVTFLPHPLRVVASRKSLRLITTYREKETLIAASAIDYLIIIPFTSDFASMTAEDFVKNILVERLGVNLLVIGYDYSFGNNREGNVDLLKELGHKYSFAVEVLSPIGSKEMVYSSSSIRKMIADGDVKGSVPLLGRYFSLSGTVVHGHHRGKGLGFPTANIETEKELIPKEGVYAVKVKIGEIFCDGACNIGSNPTFNDDKLSIEVNIFDFTKDLYGREITLYFIERLREERSFPSPAELRKAISDDVARCRTLLQGIASDDMKLQ